MVALEAVGAARGRGRGKDVAGVAGKLDVVIRELAELGVIETELLLLGGDTERQAGNEVHEEEDDAGQDE